jgi:hypothetical protein
MNPIDRVARKQLLLTRIAYERIELRRDVARLQQAAHLPAMLRHAIGGGLGKSLFGAAGKPGAGGWVGTALALLRRYRLAASLLGGVAPVLRGRRGWRRIAILGVLAAAAWFGWRTVARNR